MTNFRLTIIAWGFLLIGVLSVGIAVGQEDARPRRILPSDINESPPETFQSLDSDSTWQRFGQLRDDWAASGLAVSGAFIWDGSQNFRGGIDTERAISRYLLNIGLSADLEELFGWRGASAFVDFQHHDGTLGDTIVGDFQVFSNIDAPRRTQIPRAWLQTHWLDDRLRIKAGKIDANTEFAYTLSGGSFLNSSMGFSPTIFVMPTYPDPAGGLIAEWNSSDVWQARIGVFDGVGATGVPTGSRLPTTLLNDFKDLFTIFEVDRNWGNQADGTLGRVAVGGWYHNGDFDRFDGARQSGTAGWFAAADQWLWNEGDCETHSSQGIAAFAQIGGADDRVSQAKTHWGLGLTWTGALETRDRDVFGVGVSGVEFTRQGGAGLTASREVATEVFYQLMLPRGWNITADLQAITNPGGIGFRSDALVSTLRITREF